ncbi:MAG: tetratricopeptide (TPR) repeat protein [Cognaticolwellia sp.]|jgi:tetratricopeptide (TPR) repeat protein|tara:strand:- start:40 stop:1062 length:1023 start_codon:yes stop_codon:yes gene_type:complete
MSLKAVITGHLDFGLERSYEQALKMYRRRVETYYKDDILLEEELIFREDELSLVIGKFNTNCSKRFWRNTYLLLDYVSQFAISGYLHIWLLEEGIIKKEVFIEPRGDRSTVILYHEGNNLMKEGKIEEAIVAFTKSLGKYPKNSSAYEKRGMMYQELNDLENARSDFESSLALYDGNARANFGLGKIALNDDRYQDAINYFEQSIKGSIPHQPIYWTCRYMKGDAHAILGEWGKAAQEYKFFCYRNFTADNPNFKYHRLAHLKWGKALMKLEDKGQDALKAFDDMLKIKSMDHDGLTVGEMRLWRGKARFQVGKKGFKEDWKEAAKAGYDEASTLLATYK